MGRERLHRAGHRLDAAERAGDRALLVVDLEGRQRRDRRQVVRRPVVELNTVGEMDDLVAADDLDRLEPAAGHERRRLGAAVDDGLHLDGVGAVQELAERDHDGIELPGAQDDVDAFVGFHARPGYDGPCRTFVRRRVRAAGRCQSASMRVLVVEDGPGRAAQLAASLDAAAPGEFELVAHGTLTEMAALLLGIDRPPLDCIVLVLDGPDLQALMRLRTAALAAPVVVRGGGDDAFALRCVEGGAQDHVAADADGQAIARALRHAVERRRRENAVLHQALHDPLTALPNRTLFFDRLNQALSRLERTQTKLAVLFLDLDAFKQVNDERGHAAGDALLHDVAVRLVHALRGGDTAARIGGDEFVVLCEDIASAAEALAVGERLLAELPTPASMGVALCEHGTVAADELVRRADEAMYRMKRRGGGAAMLADDA